MSQIKQYPQNIYFSKIAQDTLEVIKSAKKGLIIMGGGNSPKELNKELLKILSGQKELSEHFFSNFTTLISDERYVPIDHPDSNFNMLNKTLFCNSSKLISYPTELPIDQCVEKYHEIVGNLLKKNDIVLSILGIGDDGHTASLFPGQIPNSDKFVLDGGKGPEGHLRVSLSHKLLLKSKNIFFLGNKDTKKQAWETAKCNENFLDYPLTPFVKNDYSTIFTVKS